MKILVISPVGEEVHVRKIPAALRQHNSVEVTVIAPEKSATETAYEASGWRTVTPGENANGCRVVTLPLVDPSNGHAGFDNETLKRAMQEAQPDVIQMWGGAPARSAEQVVWQKMRACPQAKTVFYGFDQLPYRFAPWTQLKWKFLWSRMAGGIEANSEGVEALRQAGFRKPLTRIFWGVETDVYRPMERAAMRRKLGLEHEHIVGFAGRFVEEKGLRVLLDALAKMPSSVHAVLIGNGPLREDIEAHGNTGALQGRVHVLGTMATEELAAYMNCFDALALPSLTARHWKEQYGRVIGEAMACGTVVVGSDSGAIPEVVGEAGVIVREGDAKALAQGLEGALFDETLRARMIPAGKKRAEEELSIEAMSRKLMEFYGRLEAI
ncbi:MAG: glycosyltransferase family 4 protein [Acidobacteria bacterium]|nr:glycosyltransferase family 4 protein [Acidobacteriota bacterium]